MKTNGDMANMKLIVAIIIVIIIRIKIILIIEDINDT